MLLFMIALILSLSQTGLPGSVAGQGTVTTEAADQGEPEAWSPAATTDGGAEQGLSGVATGQ